MPKSQRRRNDNINKICILEGVGEGGKFTENCPKTRFFLGSSMTIKIWKLLRILLSEILWSFGRLLQSCSHNFHADLGRDGSAVPRRCFCTSFAHLFWNLDDKASCMGNKCLNLREDKGFMSCRHGDIDREACYSLSWGGTKRGFGKLCFCPLPKRGRFDENGENDEFAFYSLKTRASLLRPPKTTKMTKMAGVTQAKAWFRKSGFVLP